MIFQTIFESIYVFIYSNTVIIAIVCGMILFSLREKELNLLGIALIIKFINDLILFLIRNSKYLIFMNILYIFTYTLSIYFKGYFFIFRKFSKSHKFKSFKIISGFFLIATFIISFTIITIIPEYILDNWIFIGIIHSYYYPIAIITLIYLSFDIFKKLKERKKKKKDEQQLEFISVNWGLLILVSSSFFSPIYEIMDHTLFIIGILLSTFGYFREIHEGVLKKSERNFRKLLETIPDMLFKTDLKGNFLYVNNILKSTYSNSEEKTDELLTMNIIDLIRPTDRKSSIIKYQPLLEGKSVQNLEYRLQTKIGAILHLLLNSTPVLDENGNVTAMVTVARDISERKRAEKELEKKTKELIRSNTDLQNFAYAASHDLKEPLRTISSYLKLLQSRYNQTLDKKAKNFIDKAMNSAERMQSLVKGLLNLSHVDVDRVQFKPTDLNDILEIVLSNLKITIEQSGAEIVHDKLPTIMGDSSLLIQLFQNLIGNAIKFIQNKIPKIHIGVKKKEKSGQKEESWWIYVQDNGIGIEHKDLNKIFTIFQRLHSRAEYEGTGIGLAICKKIVKRHEGRIWVESEVGKGTTFFFSLPVIHKEKTIIVNT
ncbi:MAG: sensor histidine kinase [Promethearchaeota archaeon]